MTNSEKVMEIKVCRHCQANFDITDKDLEFYEKVSPVFNGKKYTIPSPTLCPDCRQQRRLSWRNERKLYKRKCDFSGKDIFAFYSENVPFPVYDRDIWHSDKWDAVDYGVDFDFSKPFFEQFLTLMNTVPHFSRSVINGVNSEYSNNFHSCKNCYLCFNGGNAEDCYYCVHFQDTKNCIDCYQINESENCYGCVDCHKCNKVFFSQDSSDCFNSSFLKNCIGCQNCFGCKNLTHKSYCIKNKQYTKEEYQNEVEGLLKKYSVDSLRNGLNDFFLGLPEKYTHGLNNEHCTGDYIYNSKNTHKCSDIVDCENIRYCADIKEVGKDLMDIDIFGFMLSNCYESSAVGDNGSKLLFSYDCWGHVDKLTYYTNCVENTKNCFGCVGVRGKEYCIFNKQYTKEEYEALVPRIIEHMMKTGEWGEFFPSSLSPFGYNETAAVEYYPIERRDVSEKHLYPNGTQIFNWSDYEAPFPRVEKIIPADKLPDDIAKIPDDILNWAIECEVTKKPFRIIKQELEFYRKHNLPIPRRHPDQRHLDRMALRSPRKLFERKCDKCGVEMVSTYSPERPETVYCGACYDTEVLG